MTPVPRILISASRAGPAPSGSPGRVPASSGLLPPSPAPPGSGCPRQQRPTATGRRRRSFTSTRTTAPFGARRAAWKPLVVVKLFLVECFTYQGFSSLSGNMPHRDHPVTLEQASQVRMKNGPLWPFRTFPQQPDARSSGPETRASGTLFRF